MNCNLRLSLLAALCLAVSSRSGPAQDSDAKKMQGSWKVIAFDGDEEKKADTLASIVLIQGDRLIIRSKKFGDEETRFKLDPAKKPKEIDLIMEGKVGDMVIKQTAPGIYDLDGDKLTLAVGKDQRPRAFGKGRDATTLVLMREKK